MSNFRRYLVLLAAWGGLLAPHATAQTDQGISPATPSGWNCNASFPEATLTPDMYWASKRPEIRALHAMQPDGAREAAATALANKGFTVDANIDGWGWDPVCTMGIRKNYGYTWVPSVGQPFVPLPPGLSFPGLPAYDPANPPPGSIKVSLNSQDYKPFDPPAPPPPPANADIVGPCFGSAPNVVCTAGNGWKNANLTDGQKVVQAGHTYLTHRYRSLMGDSVTFTPVN